MSSDTKKNIGEILREIRLADGLSQRGFAPLVGISVQTLMRWEAGQTEPSGIKLRRVERYLEHRRAAPIVAEPAPPPPGLDHGPTPTTLRGLAAQAGQDVGTAVPEHMRQLDLLLMEFGAWARRKALNRPELLDVLERQVRRVINETEQGKGEEEKQAEGERQLAS